MRIAISSEPKLLPILQGAVRWQARESGFSEADAESLALAIDEAAANVIRYSYGGRPGLMLSLEMAAHPDRMEFILEDSGPKVKAPAGRSPLPGDVCPGGSETPFIQTAIDTSCYDTGSAAGNRLKLVKFLPGKAPGSE